MGAAAAPRGPRQGEGRVLLTGEGPLGPRYQVEGLLGEGAFGQVFRAQDRELGRRVAIKVLRADVATDATRARFEREARLAASVEHPNVVRLLDHGRTPSGAPFLVFEFVEGASLADRLDTGVAPETWLAWVRDVAAGLAALHTAGVVHRDVKAANVLVHGDGRAMLADLGLARSEELTSDGLTRTGALVGTPAYMAPEVLHGWGESGPAADLFAVGCLAYRGLYGHDWRSTEDWAALMRGDQAPPPPPARFGRFPRVDGLLRTLLAPDPADRPSSAAVVAAQLAEGPGEETVVLDPVAPELRDPAPAPAVSRRGWAALAAAALVVGWFSGGGPPPVPTPPVPVAATGVDREALRDEVRRLGAALPNIDRKLERAEGLEAADEEFRRRVDYRFPPQARRFLEAVAALLRDGYRPGDDGFWEESVVDPGLQLARSLDHIGSPRIAGTILDPDALATLQEERDRLEVIQREGRDHAFAFVDAMAQEGILGQDWRVDRLLTRLVNRKSSRYGEVVLAPLDRAARAGVRPALRRPLVHSVVTLIFDAKRLGCPLPELEEVAAVVVGALVDGVDLGELRDLLVVEQFLRERRALAGVEDPEAQARGLRRLDRALVLTESPKDRTRMIADLHEDYRRRMGLPTGTELPAASLGELEEYRDRLRDHGDAPGGIW